MEAVGSTQTNVSRHLAIMYRAGALRRRREGAFTYYAVADESLTDICRTVCVQIAARIEERPVDRDQMVNFVLNAPRKEELPLIDDAIERSLDTWPLLLDGKCEAAMLKLHTKA